MNSVQSLAMKDTVGGCQRMMDKAEEEHEEMVGRKRDEEIGMTSQEKGECCVCDGSRVKVNE